MRKLVLILLGLSRVPIQAQTATTRPFSVLAARQTALARQLTINFAIGDFNADGKPDAVVMSYAVDSQGSPQSPNLTSVYLFLGLGDGTFQPPKTLVTFPGFAGYVGSGDFNGDGKLDLAIMNSAASNTTATLEVLLDRGDGTFLAAVTYPASLFGLRPFFVADMNRDGKLDIVSQGVGQASGGAVLLGNGDGTFQDPIPFSGFAYAVADFNLDGILDLAAAPVGGPLTILLGRGDGTFGSGKPITTPPTLNNVVGSYNGFAIGDFNGDGKPDLIISQSTSGSVGAFLPAQMAVLFGNGDGTFQSPKFFVGPGSSVVLADLNQDGKLDLISTYAVLLGNGDGTFASPLYLATPSYQCSLLATIFTPRGISDCGNYYIQIQVADMNGDGLPDLVSLGPQPPADANTLLTTYINDSPGDGFLTTGIPSTGQKNSVLGDPPGATSVTQQVTTVAPLGFSLGENSLVSAFGINLAPTTEAAVGPPFPTLLGGIRLHLGDSLAQLLYVSPTQINYLSPPGPYIDSIGNIVGPSFNNPTITVERVGTPLVPKGLALPIAPDAPSFFTLNSSGLAAATAVRVAPDGTQTPVPVFDCSTTPCQAVPIDARGDPVYLSLYGTGFDYNTSFFLGRQVNCGGITPTYVGPQGTVPGLNQINIRLPAYTGGTISISCELVLSQLKLSYRLDMFSNSVTILTK